MSNCPHPTPGTRHPVPGTKSPPLTNRIGGARQQRDGLRPAARDRLEYHSCAWCVCRARAGPPGPWALIDADMRMGWLACHGRKIHGRANPSAECTRRVTYQSHLQNRMASGEAGLGSATRVAKGATAVGEPDESDAVADGLCACAAAYPPPPAAINDDLTNMTQRDVLFSVIQRAPNPARWAMRLAGVSPDQWTNDHCESHPLKRIFWAFLKSVWPAHCRLSMSWSGPAVDVAGSPIVLGYIQDWIVILLGLNVVVLKFDIDGLHFSFAGGRTDLATQNQHIQVDDLWNAWRAFAAIPAVRTHLGEALASVDDNCRRWREWMGRAVPRTFCGRPVRIGLLADNPPDVAAVSPSSASPPSASASSSAPASSSLSASSVSFSWPDQFRTADLTSLPATGLAQFHDSEAKTEAAPVPTPDPCAQPATRKRTRSADRDLAKLADDRGGGSAGDPACAGDPRDAGDKARSAKKSGCSDGNTRADRTEREAKFAVPLFTRDVRLQMDNGGSSASVLGDHVRLMLGFAVDYLIERAGALPARCEWVLAATARRVGPLQVALRLELECARHESPSA